MLLRNFDNLSVDDEMLIFCFDYYDIFGFMSLFTEMSLEEESYPFIETKKLIS